MNKIVIIVGFPILSKLVRGNSVELSNCVLIPDDQLFNESKKMDCCVPMDAKTELVEESPSASDNRLMDASKLLGRCLAALRSAGIEGKLRSDVSEWLATYQHP